MNLLKKTIIGLIAVLSLQACTAIQSNVDAQWDKNNDRLASSTEAVINQNVTSNVTSVQRSQKSWLGMRSTPLQADQSLPQIFRQNWVFNYPGKVDISTVAERITKITGIPVSVKPDVFLPLTAFVTGGASALQGAGQAGAVPVVGNNPPLPALPVPIAGFNNAANMGAIPGNTLVDMNYQGLLDGYLDLLSAKTGVSWEYREGVISIHRLMTKVFTLKAIPGSSKFESSLGKTANANAGANSSTSGFISTSTVEMKSEFSVWNSLELAVKSMLSPSGKMAMSEASGHITVTDTKDVVDQVGRLIDAENAMLVRQVAVRVEVLAVRLNNGSDYGIDWDSVYKSVSNNFSLRYSSPLSLVPSGASSLGVSILTPVAGSGSQGQFAGSQAFLHAMSSYGRVSVVTTANAMTLNRQPVPLAITKQVSYLAEITPAPAGGAGVSGGTPGLKPGIVTTGFMLNLLPTVLDSNSILLQIGLGISDLDKLDTQSSGVGGQMQSIRTPETSGRELVQKVSMRPGETLVLSGYERVAGSYDRRTIGENTPVGFGGSFSGLSNREAIVILVTPVLSDSAI